MAQPSVDAVLAGTKGFAVALLAPLTNRVGTRPRVAADAGQVLGLCGTPGALVIIEFLGEGSLAAIQALVRDGRQLRVVAGVPAAHASAEEPLRALGVQVARWDGKVDGVLGAVDRALGAGAASQAPAPAAPQAPRAPAPVAPRPPAVAQPAPARPAAPAAPAAPARPPQAGPPVAPRQAAPAAPRPAAVAQPAAAPRPAPVAPAAQRPLAAAAPAAAAPVAPRPPSAAAPTAPRVAAATTAARPPAAAPPPPPVAQARPAVPRPAPAAAPRTAPAVASAPAIPPPAPAASLATGAPASPAAAPAPPVPAAAAPPAAQARPAPRPATQFFADLDEGDLSVEVADVGPALAPPVAGVSAPGVYLPPPVPGKVAWPAGICSPDQAEDALRRAMNGAAPASEQLGALAQKTLETLSAVERAVLAGEPQPVDAGPIRKAAVMRLRVAEALASAPPTGSAVDSAALSGILGEIDALLAEVAPILSAAPPELAPALETVRNALVSEAIDFSEAAQRVAVVTAAAPAAAMPRKVAAVRIIENYAEQERPPEARRIWLWVLLGLVFAGVGAYHAQRFLARPKVVEVATVPGAPEGLRLVEAGGKRMLVALPGRKVDSAQVEVFRAQQALKGIEVREVTPGLYALMPAAPAGGGKQ